LVYGSTRLPKSQEKAEALQEAFRPMAKKQINKRDWKYVKGLFNGVH
jgi:hypothetical protein